MLYATPAKAAGRTRATATSLARVARAAERSTTDESASCALERVRWGDVKGVVGLTAQFAAGTEMCSATTVAAAASISLVEPVLSATDQATSALPVGSAAEAATSRSPAGSVVVRGTLAAEAAGIVAVLGERLWTVVCVAAAGRRHSNALPVVVKATGKPSPAMHVAAKARESASTATGMHRPSAQSAGAMESCPAENAELWGRSAVPTARAADSSSTPR